MAKLRGVAGIREDKISEAERELHEAGQKEKQAAETYELIVQRMSEDLARFQVSMRNINNIVLYILYIKDMSCRQSSAMRLSDLQIYAKYFRTCWVLPGV